MKPIFPRPQMPLNQKCLLLCCFQKIIREDIKNSKSQNDTEWKELWFEKWENQVETYLKPKRDTITKLHVLKDPNEKIMDILDNLDIQLLYNNIQKEISNCGKAWEIKLYRQCCDFDPYDWDDLLQKEKRGEKEWYKELYKHIKRLCPNLRLDFQIQQKTLSCIYNFLYNTNTKP